MEPIAFPLYLVELGSLFAAHIKANTPFIHVLFFSCRCLKWLQDDFPGIVLRHYLDHRQEVTVDQGLDDVTAGTKDF